MPTQLNVTLTISGNPVVAVPISAGLQALDSNNAGGQGQVASPNATTGIYSGGQTGFSSVDMAVRNIFRAGCFFVPSTSTWYSSQTIQSITWS
jgi:hypothetical protein